MSLSFAEALFTVSNWVLVAALVVGVFATYFVVTTGTIKENALKRELKEAISQAGEATERAGAANERAAEASVEAGKASERASTLELTAQELRHANLVLQADVEREKSERLKMELALKPRSLTKEQYEAMQSLRGLYTAINVGYETDGEPSFFAMNVAVALGNAGIKSYLCPRGASTHGGTTSLYDKRAFDSSMGPPTMGHPLIDVLMRSGIMRAQIVAARLPGDMAGCDEDVPMIIIGGGDRGLPPERPYLAPRAEDGASATK